MSDAAVVTAFLDRQPFSADRFQREALDHVVAGSSVVVTAPTGSGKTLIAQGAVEGALASGSRAFYTTPIKALSNQKFAEFRALHGDGRVGLLTGDNVINGDAPVVVMTTEVLRNMIYADSAALVGLGVVILDEVHYLQDRYRGPVWEEVIIHLPANIPIVALSATIANAEEFTGWIRERRGTTALVAEHERPVPLESLYLVTDRHHGTLPLLPVFSKSGDRPNPELVRLLRKGRGRRRRFATPRRLEVAQRLAEEQLLPAIYFIFSRAGCDRAAATVGAAGLPLTTPDERAAIRDLVAERTSHLSEHDLAVLSFASWRQQLEHGVAAHHAGMVPAFKEAVEDVFAAGLVKLVFATETLALGINMPARSVVLENLSKFSGEGHELLQPGDYTQLTGRAGRRGIDSRGSAVVLYSQYVPFERVAGIAGTGSHALRSSFQPTYNMAVNLAANYGRNDAFGLLQASFAGYRQGERRRSLEQRLEERERQVAEFRDAATCERGDLWAYLERAGSADSEAGLWALLRRMQPGDVIEQGSVPGRWVLLARSWGGRTPRLLLLSDGGELVQLRPKDMSSAVTVLGTMELPEPFTPRSPDYQREVALLLREWKGSGAPADHYDIAALEDPVASCPRLDDHQRNARRAARAQADADRLRRRIDRQGTDLVEQFEGVLGVLAHFGYLDRWRLTDRGQELRWVYNELDLLLTEAVGRGSFTGLAPAQLAAVASLFTFEARRLDQPGGWPDAIVAERGEQIAVLWQELAIEEERRGVPQTREPDPGFAELVHAWTLGAELDDLFGDDEFAAGDFVRNCRQLLDLLRQLRDAFPPLAATAARAVRAVDRGIVAAGGRL